MKSKQIAMLKNEKSAYGGALLKTRVGRSHARPLATRETMHLVLRSTKAKGAWSFRAPRNSKNIQRIVQRFTARFEVRVISMANVGNHLHLQIKLANRFAYRPFIRAVTGAIAISVTGRTPWAKAASEKIEHRHGQLQISRTENRSRSSARPSTRENHDCGFGTSGRLHESCPATALI